ncbi:alpha/beta hydrolase fold domain-containing protein [Halomonas sp. HMF6819]|uniref:alpha/beta hydrolase fold domain-containing protein n=1 Tax=Halomonas sp. HMF6819 TaxID=3373085 RepID=UPI0037895D0A
MEIATFIRHFEAGLRALSSQPMPEARRSYEALCQQFTPPIPKSMRIEASTLAGVGVTHFVPARRVPGPIVFLHGGSFTLGSSRSHRGISASLAQRLAREVISVDYPLAPEANVETMTLRCLMVVGAAHPAALVGDSAGARLAMDLATRLNGEWPLGLIYPPVNGLSEETLGPDAPLLSRQDVLSLGLLYPALLSPAPTPMPARAIEVLAVENDPLTGPLERDIERWRQQGAAIGYRCAPTMVHGALHAHALLPNMQSAWQDFCQALEQRLLLRHS